MLIVNYYFCPSKWYCSLVVCSKQGRPTYLLPFKDYYSFVASPWQQLLINHLCFILERWWKGSSARWTCVGRGWVLSRLQVPLSLGPPTPYDVGCCIYLKTQVIQFPHHTTVPIDWKFWNVGVVLSAFDTLTSFFYCWR